MLRKLLMAGLLSLGLTVAVSAQTDATAGLIVEGFCMMAAGDGLWLLTPEGDASLVAEDSGSPQWLTENKVSYVGFNGELWMPLVYDAATGATNPDWVGVQFTEHPFQVVTSPDEMALAFLTTDGREDDPQDQLVIVDKRGPDYTLAIPAVVKPGVAWSPASDMIAYVSSTDETLYVQEYPQGSSLPLSTPPGEILDMVWSPDGTQLAVSTFDGDAARVTTLEIGTNATLPLYESEHALIELAWSPDNTSLAMITLHVSDYTQEIILHNLEDGTNETVTLEGQAMSLGWSPDSQSLAFIELTMTGMLTVLDVESGEKTALTGEDFFAEGFAWSPHLPAEGQWPAAPVTLCEA